MKKFIFTGLLCLAVSATAIPAYAAESHHGHGSGYCYEDGDCDGVCDYFYDDDCDGYCDHCANQGSSSQTQCGGHNGHGHGRHHG